MLSWSFVKFEVIEEPMLDVEGSSLYYQVKGEGMLIKSQQFAEIIGGEVISSTLIININ